MSMCEQCWLDAVAEAQRTDQDSDNVYQRYLATVVHSEAES